jgi:hypothetical protein
VYVSLRSPDETSQTETLPSSDPVANTDPSALNAMAITRPVARRPIERCAPVRRSTILTLPSSCPNAASSAVCERAAAPETGKVRTRRNVRTSNSEDVVSPLVTSNSRPSRVKPINRAAAMALERRSSVPSAAVRSTSTSAGGPPAPDTPSPLTTVRPPGAKTTSAVTPFLREVMKARVRRLRVSTSASVAWRPSLSPTASVRPSGLKARARFGLTTAPK